MTEEQMHVSKEDYEKWRMEQIKLEMQSPKSPKGFNVRISNEIKNSDGDLNLIKEILKDYNNCLIDFQECEGTFKVKDGNVTDINITGIALVPRFRDKK